MNAPRFNRDMDFMLLGAFIAMAGLLAVMLLSRGMMDNRCVAATPTEQWSGHWSADRRECIRDGRSP